VHKKDAVTTNRATLNPKEQIRPRPATMQGVTYRTSTPLGSAFITVNHNGDGQPFEVFVNLGKGGSDTGAVSEAIGRLISLTLRLPSPHSPRERLEHVVNQLAGIGGRRNLGLGKTRVRSVPDAIAQVLAEHIGLDGDPTSPEQATAPTYKARPGDLCPDCGAGALVYEEGCQKCHACGFSEC
jgi:ribonucleoside-diphosphate reductase alpha chain